MRRGGYTILPAHGELAESGPYRGSRWCAWCGHFHGPLYGCAFYPLTLLAELKRQSDRFLERVRDGSAFPPGTPEDVKVVCRALYGGPDILTGTPAVHPDWTRGPE